MTKKDSLSQKKMKKGLFDFYWLSKRSELWLGLSVVRDGQDATIHQLVDNLLVHLEFDSSNCFTMFRLELNLCLQMVRIFRPFQRLGPLAYQEDAARL